MTEKQKAKEAEREAKRQARLQKEIERTESLMVYEKQYMQQGPLCGIDEVGRGPLAGPVMAGAVILPTDHMILGINDSKKLTPRKRDELYEIIMKEAVAVGLGLMDVDVIDDINILQATYAAMRQAIGNLSVRPHLLLVDAVTIPGVDIPECPIIKGDAKSVSIGAASIVAKVTRDRLMEEYDKVYPAYGFAKNKGYGTAEHIAALKKYGPCPIHRKTFLKKILAEA
ncbi:MAG: ribonuclease HII [Lachnospiraceae bacterium]|nr:ribonuclease HII [Lachnospiraceae bacterium]